MNQIYACRKGREIPFTDTTSISTVPTASRSGSRTDYLKLLGGASPLKSRLRFVIPMLIAFVLGFASNKASAQVCLNQNFDGPPAPPALPAGWTTATTGAASPWVKSATGSFSAPNNAFSQALPASASTTSLISPAVLVTSPTAVLRFQNNYNLETNFDGMVLEISFNAGATWTDIIAAGGAFVVNGYNGALAGASNPLFPSSVWTGNSGGYVQTIVNLPAAANGQNTMFRWRVGSDASIASVGVRIDDVILDCGACVGRVHNVQTGLSYCTIQSAIDAAATLDGHTLNIDNGTYDENLSVHKDLTLNGQSQAGVIVRPPVGSTPGVVGGGTCGGTTVILVQDDGVTIQNLTVDGDGPGVGAINARNGIFTDFCFVPDDYTNLTVNNVTVRNLFFRGIYTVFNAVPGQTFTITNNTLSNIGLTDPDGIAIFNWGNTGTISGNTITNVLQGIHTNHSLGTVITGNNITTNAGGTGIQSLQNGSVGGAADNINNNITSGGANGIIVAANYLASTVNNNSVSNYTDYGIGVVGHGTPGPTLPVTVTNNDINGNNNATTSGILISTLLSAFQPGGFDQDVSALVNNNAVTNNTTDAISLETTPGETNTTTGHFNSFGLTNANGASSASTGGAGGVLVADLTCNWWGSTDLATVDSRVDDGVGVVGAIAFVPYLTNGTDVSAARGHQPDPANAACAAPCSNITTTISTVPSGSVCQGQPANLIMTGAGGVAPYIFNYTLNGVPQAPATSNAGGTATVPINTASTSTQTFEIVSVTGANGCTNPPNPPPTSATIFVRPLPAGTIFNSGGQTICAGTSGVVNVFLQGTPRFDGCFTITVINGLGSNSTYCWQSMQVGGPQGIIIPAANLPNTSNQSTTYRISWASLTDNQPGGPACVAPANQLTGFEDIVVLPLPTIDATPTQAQLNAAGDVCPGTNPTFNVTNPNAVPGSTFNYVVRDALGNTITSAQNQPFGNVTPNLGFTAANCNNINNPLTYTFTPAGPNPNQCQGAAITRTVNVRDITPPSLIGPAPGNSSNHPNTCITAIPAPPSAATIQGFYQDNCTVLHSSSSSAAPTGTNCSWSRVTTYSIADACNNTTTFTFTQTGGDQTAPVFNQQPGSLNRTVQYCDLNSPDNPGAMTAGLLAAQALTPTATDNCGSPVTITKSSGIFAQAVPGACTHNGTFTNTWTAVDGCNNSTTFTQVITVVDNQGPTFGNVPASTTLNIGAGANCTVPLPDYVNQPNFVNGNNTVAGTTTDCAAPGGFPPAGPVTFTQTPAAGTPVTGLGGQITVTIRATDVCGNFTDRPIVVNLVDQTPPTAICKTSSPNPIPVVLNAQGNSTLTPAFFNNGSFDNCSAVTFSLTYAGFEPNPFPPFTVSCNDVGLRVITLVVTDGSGNQSTCTVNINVIDNTPPVFTQQCPMAPITMSRDAGCTVTLPNFITNTPPTPNLPVILASDACGVQSIGQSPIPGTVFGANVSSTTVTFTATDVNGNTTTCTMVVNFVDDTDPVITCPTQVQTPSNGATFNVGPNNTFTVNTAAGNTDCTIGVTFANATATDNCAVFPNPTTITPVRTQGPASGSQFFVGPTLITFTATDAAGNTSSCSFTILVVDNTAPTISGCSNRSVNANTAGCSFTNSSSTWNATGSDNCLSNPSVTYTLTGATTASGLTTLVGQVFNLGVTTVTATVSDNFQTAQCSFTVTVTDSSTPTVTGPCGQTFTRVANNPGCTYRTLANGTEFNAVLGPSGDVCPSFLLWEVTGATPNTSGVGQLPAGFVFSQGTSVVTYRASDNFNNTSGPCSFTVIVNSAVTGMVQVGTPPASSTTVAQSPATNTLVTFTGSGSGAPAGQQQYQFTYRTSTDGANFSAPTTITTAVGSNTATVIQSNAATGTFYYRLDAVTDLATGCAGTVTPPNTAVINVVVGSDLTPVITNLQGLNFPTAGTTRDFLISVVNIGATPSTPGTIVRIPKLSAFTFTVQPNITTLGGQPVNNSDWTIDNSNPTFLILTLNASVPAGGQNSLGLTVTRNVGVAPNTSQPLTATIQDGTGGDQTPLNNTAVAMLTAQ